MSRGYHNLTSHYNVYFNGIESLKAGQQKIVESNKNDYTQILPVYEHSDSQNTQSVTAEMDRAIEKGSLLIAKHSITKKPKKKPTEGDEYYKAFYNQKEFNKWVDDAYILMGKGAFYKHDFDNAIMTFDHVIRDFQHEPTRYDALLWKAASYAEKGDFTNARLSMTAYDASGTPPQSRYADYMTINADLQLKQLHYEASVPYLKGAIEATSNKQRKTRLMYILAQVLQETGQYQESQKAFQEVIKQRPPYEMAFNAAINKVSMITPNANTEEIKRDINRMLRDKKNIDYRDRIYYALALVYNSEGDDKTVIENLKLSTQYSVDNDKQKATSFVMMGDVYYSKPLYKQAFEAYDSAMVYLPQTDASYPNVSKMHGSLKLLVEKIDAKEEQDSLQKLAKMPENMRLAVIDKILADEQKRIEEKKKQQEANDNYDPFLQQSLANSSQTSESSSKWYFYNLSNIALGKAEFQRRWGKRKLEDNWRRVNKAQVQQDTEGEGGPNEAFEGLPDEPGKTASAPNGEEIALKPENQPMTRTALLANIPITTEALAKSDSIISQSLISMGVIYRDQFNDFNSSAEALESYLKRYPSGKQREEALIELYRSYEQAKNQDGMNSVKERLSKEFPGSKFTEYINNPNYLASLQKKKAEQDAAYEKSYYNYLNGNYNQVITDAIAIEINPDENSLLPKYRLIKGLSQARQGNTADFKSTLEVVVNQHKNTEEASLAQLFLNEIANGRTPVKSETSKTFTAQTETSQSSTDATTDTSVFSNFTIDASAPHSFFVWVPSTTNTKRLLFNFADFNFGNYLIKDFDLNITTMPDQSFLLEVKTFGKQSEAMEYFYTLRQHPEVFVVDGIQQPIMMVGNANNIKFVASSGDVKNYIQFFIQVYLKGIKTPVPMTPAEVDESIGNLYPDSQNLKAMLERQQAEKQAAEKLKTYTLSSGEHWFAMIYPGSPTLDKKLQTDIQAYNKNQVTSKPLQVKITTFNEKYSLLVVSSFENESKALAYQKKVTDNPILLRNVRSKKPELFIISPSNYDVLISTGDFEKYKAFYNSK
jgi:tetratricopeptide (TPR) repeat protein